MKLYLFFKLIFWVMMFYNHERVSGVMLKSQLDFFNYNQNQDFSDVSSEEVKTTEKIEPASLPLIGENISKHESKEITELRKEETGSISPNFLQKIESIMPSSTNIGRGIGSDINTNEIDDKLKEMMEDVYNLNSKDKIKRLKSKSHLVDTISSLVTKYTELKENMQMNQLSPESRKIFMSDYYKKRVEEQRNNRKKESLFSGNSEEVIKDNLDYLQKFRFKSLGPTAKTSIPGSDQVTQLELKESNEKFQNKNHFKASPYNIIITKPDLVFKNKEKLRIDNTLLHKVRLDNSYAENVIARSIPLQDCNKNWDYRVHGDNWNCMCECGSEQSPIDLRHQDINNLRNSTMISDNIYFDFAEPTCEFIYCRKPIIKNTGNLLEVKYDCGKLILPPHLNGYSCYKLEFHTPSEHKIDGEELDLELQIFFKLKNKNIVDKNTMDYVILVVFFKGLEKENLQNIKDTIVKNHAFLEQFTLTSLPMKAGEAVSMTKLIDFALLFDKSKQPYEFKTKDKVSKVGEGVKDLSVNQPLTGNDDGLAKAINDFKYNKNNPLDEYFLYNGSFTKPPCDENITYIIYPNPRIAPLSQIIDISKAISSAGSKTGNNRRIQPSNGRKVRYFKINDKDFDALNTLDLLNPASTIGVNPIINLQPSTTKTSMDKSENNLIDTVLNLGNKDIDNILKSNNIK